MQCTACGQDVSHLLSGVTPEQYAAMLTADNAKEVVQLVPDGQQAVLLEAKADLSSAADVLVSAENMLHGSVTAMCAAAVVQVCPRPPSKHLWMATLFQLVHCHSSPCN